MSDLVGNAEDRVFRVMVQNEVKEVSMVLTDDETVYLGSI